MIRQGWRAVRLLVPLAFRVDPVRSVGTVVYGLMDAAVPLRALALGLAVTGVARGNLNEALVGTGLVALLSAALGIGNLMSLRLSLIVAEKSTVEMDHRVMELTDGIATLEPFERPDFHDRLQVVRGASIAVASAVRTVTLGFVVSLRIFVALFVLARLHPALLLLPLAALPSVWATGAASRLRHRSELAIAEKLRLSGHLFGLPTTAHASKELRIFGLQDEVMARHREAWESILASRRSVELKAAAITTAGWVVFGLAFVAGIAVVARAVVEGAGSPGDVAAALLIGSELSGNISRSASVYGSFSAQVQSIGHYLWLMDYAESVQQHGAGAVPVPARLTEGVSFRSVSFRYPAGDTDVLCDIDLDLPAGSTVALVGDNGAGKTTLVKLLAGFYKPTDGRIRVDGVPLEDFAITEWRSRLSGAFQDYARFEFLAREVVGVGDVVRAKDAGAVEGALARAGASDLEQSLEHGLDTQLGRSFGGQDLSAGQWQKLALARSMMRENPLVLILDEPTASLDAETEHALFERYAGAAREVARQSGAITLLVSHRFTTVRMADLIVVIDGGRVVEKGSHEELLARAGTYAELFEIQARGYS